MLNARGEEKPKAFLLVSKHAFSTRLMQPRGDASSSRLGSGELIAVAIVIHRRKLPWCGLAPSRVENGKISQMANFCSFVVVVPAFLHRCRDHLDEVILLLSLE